VLDPPPLSPSLRLHIMPALALQWSDATLFNLSLLTSDIWAVLAGALLFGQHLHGLYFLALAIIVAGLLLYNLVPLPPAPVTDPLTHEAGLADSVGDDGVEGYAAAVTGSLAPSATEAAASLVEADLVTNPVQQSLATFAPPKTAQWK
jgi:hypothetical protein